MDGVKECLLVLSVFIELFDFLEFVEQVLVEDVPHDLVGVVSDQSRLDEVLLVVNGVDELEGVE